MLVFVNHDDMRSLELMEEMLRRGYYVSDQYEDMKYADVIYLGLKGIDRQNRLLTHRETVVLDDNILKKLKKNCLVYTLAHNDYLVELSTKYDFRYHALLDDEEFVKLNSILTAEGLLAYLIMHRRHPLYLSRVMVLGYGHCAQSIIDDLLALNAKVTVSVRNEKYKQDIEERGASYQHIQELDLKNIDILVNTIPSVVVDKKELDQANSHMMIVDIASYPYGINHHYALSQGFNCQILSAIPCKYAYGCAGEMIANVIEEEVQHA